MYLSTFMLCNEKYALIELKCEAPEWSRVEPCNNILSRKLVVPFFPVHLTYSHFVLHSKFIVLKCFCSKSSLDRRFKWLFRKLTTTFKLLAILSYTSKISTDYRHHFSSVARTKFEWFAAVSSKRPKNCH